MLITSSLTVGLAITNNLIVFEVLTFLIGVSTVTPQILLPLAADLAPVERRAAAISIVFSGLMFGILIARVVSGVIANYVTWRVVYYMAIGIQYFLLVAAYLIIPNYPRKAENKHMSYKGILWSMAKIAVGEPLVIQCALINIASSACFSRLVRVFISDFMPH